MNYNVFSYIVYLCSTIYITVGVGYKIYCLGKIFLSELFPTKLEFCDRINRLLLMGYYLLNIGYIAISISFWPAIENLEMAFYYLFSSTGFILLVLGVMHMFNIVGLFLVSKSKKIIQLIST